MKYSLGQELQNWFILNKIGVTHKLFVPAVDHAFENELQRIAENQSHLSTSQPFNSRRATSSATTDSSLVPGCDDAEMAS
jgi:hypothetical protein